MQPLAVVGGLLFTGLRDVTSDLDALDGEGWWAVVLPYDGSPVCARFERDRERLVDPGQLLDGEAERGEVGPRTAVLHRERQPEQTEPPHRVDGVDGELVVPVPSLRPWGDLLLREVADDGAEGFVFLGEVEVHYLGRFRSGVPAVRPRLRCISTR